MSTAEQTVKSWAWDATPRDVANQIEADPTLLPVFVKHFGKDKLGSRDVLTVLRLLAQRGIGCCQSCGGTGLNYGHDDES